MPMKKARCRSQARRKSMPSLAARRPERYTSFPRSLRALVDVLRFSPPRPHRWVPAFRIPKRTKSVPDFAKRSKFRAVLAVAPPASAWHRRRPPWQNAGSLTAAVPDPRARPRSRASVDVDIPVRQDIANAHASKLFLQECRSCRGALLCYWTAYSRPVSSSRCERCTRDPHTLWSPHPVSRVV